MRRIAIPAVTLLTMCAVSGIAVADERIPVPPADEIAVLTPDQDTGQRPFPRVVEGADGLQHVEIAPSVVVHRYYYTGDRSFQGPFLPGGPTVIIAGHPRTGEQISVEARLLPGAPRIHYSRKSIRYDYGGSCITLDFGLLDTPTPRVIYQQQPQVVTAAETRISRMSRTIREAGAASGIRETAGELRKRSRDAVLGISERAADVQQVVLRGVTSVVDATPLKTLLTPSGRSDARSQFQQERIGIIQGLEDTAATSR